MTSRSHKCVGNYWNGAHRSYTPLECFPPSNFHSHLLINALRTEKPIVAFAKVYACPLRVVFLSGHYFIKPMCGMCATCIPLSSCAGFEKTALITPGQDYLHFHATCASLSTSTSGTLHFAGPREKSTSRTHSALSLHPASILFLITGPPLMHQMKYSRDRRLTFCTFTFCPIPHPLYSPASTASPHYLHVCPK